jgi:hypothetical protein
MTEYWGEHALSRAREGDGARQRITDQGLKAPKNAQESRPLISATTAATHALFIFEANLQRISAPGFTVQSRDSGASFMAFHLNKAEAPAIAGEYVGGQANRTHSPVLRKQVGNIVFRRVWWQVADKHFFQPLILTKPVKIPVFAHCRK